MPEYISPERLSSINAIRKLASVVVDMVLLAARKHDEVDLLDRKVEALEAELLHQSSDVTELGQRMRGERIYRP